MANLTKAYNTAKLGRNKKRNCMTFSAVKNPFDKSLALIFMIEGPGKQNLHRLELDRSDIEKIIKELE